MVYRIDELRPGNPAETAVASGSNQMPFEAALESLEAAALDAAERAVFACDVIAAKQSDCPISDIELQAADEAKAREMDAQREAEEAFDRLMRCEDESDPVENPDTVTVIRRVGGKVVSVRHLIPGSDR